jgi:capsid protein
LLQLDQLEDSLLARAETAALFGAFVTDPEGSFTRDGSTGAAATRTNQFGDTEMSLEPGLLRVLPPGCSITFTGCAGYAWHTGIDETYFALG